MRLTNDRVLKLSHGKENMLDRVGGHFALLSVTYNEDGITILDARIYTPFVYPSAQKLCTI